MSRLAKAWVAGFPVVAVALSCGGAETHSGIAGGKGSGADAASLFGGDGSQGVPIGRPCQSDTDCGAAGVCDPGAHTCGCGGTQVKAQTVAPNLLIVMDRSCSMRQLVAGAPKWTLAAKALTKLTQTYVNRVRFGLELFPDRHATDKCAVSSIPVPVGPGNEGPIQQLLAASLSTTDPNYPSGPCVTPIDTAIAEAASDPGLSDATRGDFALLITDGEQAGCATPGGGNPATIRTLTSMRAKGVRTFVVGFGSAVSAKSLDAFAMAGGESNPAGPNMFYDASDPASLDGALTAIAQSTLSCTLKLSAPPPNGDASLIYVYFDKTPPPVARDPSHANGWDYDAPSNSVTFYGAACTKLQSGQVTDAEVVFGCAGGQAPTGPIR